MSKPLLPPTSALSTLPSVSLPPDLSYTLQEYTATSISTSDLNSCLRLIESTSAAAYRDSSKGWSPRAKLLEMRDPEMRYLLVRHVTDAGKGDGGIGVEEALAHREDGGAGNTECSCHRQSGEYAQRPEVVEENDGDEWEDAADDEESEGEIPGFLSYIHTVDDGIPVIYIYEIHLSESVRNLSLGRRLMEIVEDIGVATGKRMAMLTVFLSNKRGIRFYEKLGYTKWDEEYIPVKRRRLRSGVKEMKPSYIIMAKDLKKAP